MPCWTGRTSFVFIYSSPLLRPAYLLIGNSKRLSMLVLHQISPIGLCVQDSHSHPTGLIIASRVPKKVSLDALRDPTILARLDIYGLRHSSNIVCDAPIKSWAHSQNLVYQTNVARPQQPL